MAFDLGFDFRGTAGYVTDPAYAVPVLAETYPHTYTAANGYSLNAGWVAGGGQAANRLNTNDARIAGINYTDGSSGIKTDTFRVDLSSGSAPGAGTYTLDLAAGDAGSPQHESVIVKDNATALITIPDTVVGAGVFIDATDTQVTASTTWTGTTVSKTFASTTCNIVVNPASSVIFTCLAHFRLTLATVARTYDFFPFFVPGLLSTPS